MTYELFGSKEPVSSSSNNKNIPVGAVMVVGGGIAGMQASLDLAEQGFKVYLVEKDSAIGGKMAQLDKTFPTNDCAMCTISPKLVETGRHPNIHILTNTEVLDVVGSAGDFMVRVKQEPRYVDMSKCVACGDCADVCPVVIPDIFNEGLSPRQAIYKRYPQAVPNAYAIEKRGIAPCRDACPAGQRAQGYIALIRNGRWEDALRVIKIDNPFPGICGRICNHRCEAACNRALVDEPINIRALKRFVTDKVYSTLSASHPLAEGNARVEIKYPDRKVAIIGAGPCGLTAAQDIIREGYPVTVFEAMPVAGGMLRLGVPEYRLPTDIIEREVQDIINLGVDLQLNSRVENLDDLFNQGFDSVLIAVGAHEGIRLPIPGATLDGVLINTRFLRDVRLGKYQNGSNGSVPQLGDRVLVLGGGNVAIDCARSAVRLGKEVHLACLESREEMPAHSWEVDAAKEEGVHLHPSRSFEQVLSDSNGRACGVECMQVESFHFDDGGRLTVNKAINSSHILECDTVIFSVGQRAGLAFIPDDAGVGLTDKRTIAINPNTFATSRPGVFAAGDSVSGTAFVIEAVANGHKAAESILRYLKGKPLEPPPTPELPVVNLTRHEIEQKLENREINKQPRIPLPEIPIKNRRNNFAEVERGYDETSAQAEAARCLACGICSECMSCVFACGRDAIVHDDVAVGAEINVGALILAPGYQIYNAHRSQEFGLGRYPNVVTSLQYERLLSASGPTQGHVRRPSDAASPKKIAFLQCVGSRDQSHDYCSSVCCMYAAKEAIMSIEHARAEGHEPPECRVFFMDTRTFSKGYEEYYRRAEHKYGVQYMRCRVSEIKENPITRNLVVRYMSDDQRQSADCDQWSKVSDRRFSLIEEEFDLVVLSVGMEISDSVKNLGRRLGVALDHYGFCHTTLFDPLSTSRSGIFVAGPFREPKDIPETVVEASGAAAMAAQLLAPARHSLAIKQDYPLERDVSGEEARIGVFVCHCGSNIGGYLDVPGVAGYARSLPGVIHAEDNLYTCSQDTVAHIIDTVKEKNLNRVVVSSCTPLTHEPLFQDAIRQAGLNPHLFEMANIRNQCSWVHSNNFDEATQKAQMLTRMAVARAAKLEGLKVFAVPVNHAALIIGGGAAGMTAALALAEQGFSVHLVERENSLGGNLQQLRYLEQIKIESMEGSNPPVLQPSNPKDFLTDIEARTSSHPLITIHLKTELHETHGFKGNFTSTLKLRSDQTLQNGSTFQIQHGVTIIATGGQEYRGDEYCYGQSERIVTQLEFEQILAGNELLDIKGKGEITNLPGDNNTYLPNSVVMIQCVGPAEKFCSRLCCTTAIKNALKLKELNPKAEISIFFRDIRTYGFKERLYTEARRQGVRFVQFKFENKPNVSLLNANNGQQTAISVRILDSILNREVELSPDLLVLSTPVIPSSGTRELASKLKISTDMDGFFLEAHVKLRPVDFSTDGIFMAGMAHYPKFLDETIAQAQAAASRAASILAQETMLTNARVANVDPTKCVGCLTCVRICPYEVPQINSEYVGVGEIVGAAYIEPAICHGCGSCVSECPAQAIQLMHYKDAQTLAKVDSLFAVREELKVIG
jgi:heterodisulfide reductase subunit A-like polyferredoxin